MSKSKIFKNFFFVLALFALIGIVWEIGWDTILKNVEHTGIWFVPIIGIWVIVYLINARAFYYIISDDQNKGAITFFKTLQITITGFALNYSTPAGMMGGVPYRIMELKTRVGVNKATSSVLLYTMMHMMAHIFFWLTSILVVALYITVSRELTLIFVVIFLFFTGMIVLFFKGYKRGILLKFFDLLVRQPFFKKRISRFVSNKQEELVEIDNQISDLYLNRRPIFYRVLALEFLGRLVNCLEVYFIIHAIGIDATYLHAFVMVSMTTLLANIFFFFPMQIGPREFGYAGAIEILKLVPKVGSVASLGVYVSLVTRIRELFWIGIGLLLMKMKAIK